jgi:nitrous oxidase accessory protein NosD
MRITGAALALTLALTAIPALAAEGRIPIWQPISIGPGQEGMYILTRDIPASGLVAIDILPGTVSVDIDLNGFTIYGSVGVAAVQAVGVDSVTVRNGLIHGGGGDGIYASDCRKVVIEDVKIEFVDNHGIALNYVANFAVRRNVIHGAAHGDGILVDGSSVDPSMYLEGTIEGNLIRECGGGIGVMMGSSVAILNNRIEATTSADGIFVSPGPQQDLAGCAACIIANNTIQEAAANGMWLSWFQNSKVYNNVVTWSGAEGIWLDVASDNNLVLDNGSSANSANGILADGGGNHFERNVLNQNGNWGLEMSSSANTYRGNTGQGNGGVPAACGGAPATTDICDQVSASTSPLGDNVMPVPL